MGCRRQNDRGTSVSRKGDVGILCIFYRSLKKNERMVCVTSWIEAPITIRYSYIRICNPVKVIPVKVKKENLVANSGGN